MTGSGFDTFTRHAAAAMTRRASLIALGAGALAAVRTPLATEAKDRDKCLDQVCSDLVAVCRDFNADLTAQGRGVDDACCAALATIDDNFGTCDIGTLVLCFL